MEKHFAKSPQLCYFMVKLKVTMQLTKACLCVCVSECIVHRQRRPRPAGVFGADGAGVDPAGLPLAVRPVALGVPLQLQKRELKARVEALPPQTGKRAPQQDVNREQNRVRLRGICFEFEFESACKNASFNHC